MLFIISVLVIFYFYRRVSKLDNRLEILEKNQGVSIEKVTNEEVHYEASVGGSDISELPDIPPPYVASEENKFVEWVKEDFMVKVGAFLLLLAFGWFVSYAVMEEWIGPAGQITLGLFAGLFFLSLGVVRIKTHAHQGGIFTVLGSTIVLLVMFAAREIYGFFDPLSASFVMLLSVAFVAFVSVKYQRERLAYSGVVLAGFAPLLAGVHHASPAELFIYLLVVTAGSVWVVWLTGWTKIILASSIITYLYSLTHIMDYSMHEKDTVLMFSFVFVSIYFVANLVSLVRRRENVKGHLLAHLLTALFTSIFLFSWVEFAMAQEWKSLVYVAWALIFAIGTYCIYLYTANLMAFYLYGAVSIAFIGAATAAELSGPVLIWAYFLEICLLVFAAAKLRLSSKSITNLSLLLIIPTALSLNSLDAYEWRSGIFHQHFVIIFTASFILFAIGLFLKSLKEKEEDYEYVKTVAYILLTGALAYGLSLVWLTLHAVHNPDTATMFSLFVYTVLGIVMFVRGTTNSHMYSRIVGSILVGMVVFRLLFVEVWNMDLVGRIITFLVVGIMLISTAFIKKIHVVENNSENNIE